MHLLSSAAVLSVVASAVYAQNNGTTNGTVHTVKVGGVQANNENLFMFDPQSIVANQGDVVQFVWTGIPSNHSVTQSSFNAPCQRLNGGFDSGWVFVPPTHNANSEPDVTWNLTVTDTSKPIWFFCKQLIPQYHCSSGMVGAINPPTSGDNTLQAFVQKAQAAAGTLPDQGIGGLVGAGASASAVPGPISGDVQFFGTPSTGIVSGTGTGTTSGAPANNTTPNSATSNMFSGPLLTISLVAMGAILA